jgi:hypothetical protein
MTPPRNYTIQELADDVRTMIAFLRQNGVIGLHEGIDLHSFSVLTEDGEIDAELLLADEFGEIEVEVPESIIRKVRWYTGRDETTSWQEPTD